MKTYTITITETADLWLKKLASVEGEEVSKENFLSALADESIRNMYRDMHDFDATEEWWADADVLAANGSNRQCRPSFSDC